jgi:hypothetical protein
MVVRYFTLVPISLEDIHLQLVVQQPGVAIISRIACGIPKKKKKKKKTPMIPTIDGLLNIMYTTQSPIVHRQIPTVYFMLSNSETASSTTEMSP